MNRKIVEKLKKHIKQSKPVYSPKFLRAIAEAREDVRQGRTYTADEVRKMLGL